MQWKQIKTLFILCFLLLDVYLLVLFFDKQKDADLSTAPQTSFTIDQRLEVENISISADLPEKDLEESYISVQQKLFTTEEMDQLADKKNQQSVVIDRNIILSRFDTPIPVPEDASKETINSLLKSKFLLPENYQYWGWNTEMNVLFFFQKKSERPIYYNQNGIIMVFLNDDNKAIYYTQTMLGEADSPSGPESLIDSMVAIQLLFDDNKLHTGDNITNVDLGFYTFIPLTSGEQVFAPTWTITVNGEKKFYVNAIENLVFSSDEPKFLTNAVSTIKSKVQKLEDSDEEDKNEIEDYILNHINQLLTTNNRSETE